MVVFTISRSLEDAFSLRNDMTGMATTGTEQADRIEHKLDVIARLLAALVTRDLKQRDQIALLDRVGLPPREIAGLVGTSPNTVRVALVQIRKDSRKKFILPRDERAVSDGGHSSVRGT